MSYLQKSTRYKTQGYFLRYKPKIVPYPCLDFIPIKEQSKYILPHFYPKRVVYF